MRFTTLLILITILSTSDANVFERVMDTRKLPTFQPQFDFGHGLSYTTFKYSDLSVVQAAPGQAGMATVAVSMKNTGRRAGKETAILYIRDEVATLTPAARRVRRFAKVDLQPDESATLNFTIRNSDIGYFDLQNKFVFEPGEFTFLIGGLSAKFTLR